MSIQYSGTTLINATFAQSAGTRAELADNVKTQLVAAGWTSVTNAASDYTLTSATTPQGLAVKLRVWDPGTGNCTQLRMSDGGGAKTQVGSLFLLPAASKIWRVVANKYQFFIMTAPVTSTREFACGGVPWLPSFLTVTAAGWCHGNAATDTDVTARASFRQSLSADVNNAPGGNMWGVWNSSTSEVNNTSPQGTAGAQRLVSSGSSGGNGAMTGFYRWADGTVQSYEPLIGWGLTGTADEGQIRGQLWDAVVFSGSYPGDTTYQFDGRTYLVVTHNNAGVTGNYQMPGTLLLAVT